MKIIITDAVPPPPPPNKLPFHPPLYYTHSFVLLQLPILDVLYKLGTKILVTANKKKEVQVASLHQETAQILPDEIMVIVG